MRNECKKQQALQSHLMRSEKRIFGIHGGGCIGLGLMADIAYQSPFGYNILATSNNVTLRQCINSQHQLWLKHGDSEEATHIDRIEMISRERHDIIRLYYESCLLALCVTPTVMPLIANDIAYALIHRYRLDGSGLKILVLMNMPDCAKFVREHIKHAMLDYLNDPDITEQILSINTFIPTVIDRIITPLPNDKIKQQFNHQLKFYPFNAEKIFSMYVPDTFTEAHLFPLMKTTKDLHVIEAIKNKYINGPHAILAWKGALSGFTTIAEAIKCPALFSFIKNMMEKEIAPILLAEYPHLSATELNSFGHAFFKRCQASTDDPVVRVGRDPMRKLARHGRIRGTLELARKHRLNISTSRLEQGMAAGFLYATKSMNTNKV